MWSSSGEEQNCSKALKSVSPSSSSSTSIPSPPPFSAYQNSRAKSMEEVWKDINLSSLQDHPSSRDDPNTDAFQRMIFQDFLARPFGKDHHQATPISARFGGGGSSPAPPPATMLTLNSGQDFHLFRSSSPLRQNLLLQPRTISHAASLSMQFDGLGSSPGMNAHVSSKKRCLEPENNTNPGDRRHKRMIKNRESAARSRAYTSELELEVDQLTKENARLREQQRQLCLAAADQRLPRKRTLHRTSTAPF